MIRPQEIQQRIEAALPGARVEVSTFRGDDHFQAVVEAPQFQGKSLVEQHRLVYAAVEEVLGGDVHALALKTIAGGTMTQPRTEEQWTEQFKRDIAGSPVFIYAKGEKNAAACGFSHRVMEVFNQLGVDYQVRNILSDPLIFDALCAFTDWPTSPQIFINGKFIGGCDIVTEMSESGELQKLLRNTSTAR